MKAENKYNRDIVGLDGTKTIVDVYRVLSAFNVVEPELQHSIKKLLCLGIRGKGDEEQDLSEAILSLEKMKEKREQEKEEGDTDRADFDVFKEFSICPSCGSLMRDFYPGKGCTNCFIIFKNKQEEEDDDSVCEALKDWLEYRIAFSYRKEDSNFLSFTEYKKLATCPYCSRRCKKIKYFFDFHCVCGCFFNKDRKLRKGVDLSKMYALEGDFFYLQGDFFKFPVKTYDCPSYGKPVQVFEKKE